MVFAVTGSTDPLELREAARRLRKSLVHLDGVARVTMIADPGEQVTIEYDSAAERRAGVSACQLGDQIRSRNSVVPGGTLHLGSATAVLRPEAGFASAEELERTPIMLPSGTALALGEVARVRRGPIEPTESLMRHRGSLAVAIGVVPRAESHLIDIGADVRDAVDRMRGELSPLEIHEVTYQPDYVDARLRGLSIALLQAIAVVALVLLLGMGRRPALVVAMVVPIVALASLGVYWAGGGVLHQMSIAAFVIALGMLVDNAIVIVEHMQTSIDRMASPRAAAASAVRELRVPLTVATLTTVGAFLPMAFASGNTADFIRSLPIVVSVALVLSLVAALVITPVAGVFLLRRRTGPSHVLDTPPEALCRFGVRHPRAVLAATFGLVALSLAGGLLLDQQFFPLADRDQIVVDLRLREGSHLTESDRVARRLERALSEREDVASVTTWVGRTVPRFYYNLSLEPRAPHISQLLVTTQDPEDTAAIAGDIRRYLAEEEPEVISRVSPLEQGPNVRAPIEARLYGADQEQVGAAAQVILSHLQNIDGAVEAHSDLDLGTPTLHLETVDAAAARRGLSRDRVAMSLLGQTRGLPVGELDAGETSVPIVLRTGEGEHTRVEDVRSVPIAAPDGSLVPLGQVATTATEWRPAAIYRRDGRRVTRVLAGLSPGATYSAVNAALSERLAEAPLPEGVEMEIGGAAEGAGSANTSMLRVLPFGILVIVLCLLWEFRSFRRMTIVLATVPLCGVGIVPGLLFSGQPFGFMSLLGTISLAGIVVNNAIVLLDVVERERLSGQTVADAVATAVRQRTRPILLTTATTMAGLMPLALSSSTLWPPLAWAMIAGMLSSTLLTLLAVPALYALAFSDAARAEAVEGDEAVPVGSLAVEGGAA
jgi:multidrug efflux pump subunit AcrB